MWNWASAQALGDGENAVSAAIDLIADTSPGPSKNELWAAVNMPWPYVFATPLEMSVLSMLQAAWVDRVG